MLIAKWVKAGVYSGYMALAEVILAPMSQEYADKALEYVSSSRIPELSEAVSRFKEMRAEGSVEIFHDEVSESSQSSVEFKVDVLRRGGFIYKPRLIVDPGRVAFRSNQEVAADMAREIYIAAQFPANGYERGGREVYLEALDVQARFMDEADIITTENDPRPEDERGRLAIAKSNLGAPSYFGSCSFEEYQEELERLVDRIPDEAYLLGRLASDPEYFVKVREAVIQHRMPKDGLASHNEVDFPFIRRKATSDIARHAVVFNQGQFIS